jgi:hypothetical protein
VEQDSTAALVKLAEERNIVLLASFVIPVLATVIMGFAESLPSVFDWRERQIKIGWDLCVLSLGSSGAVFTLPQVQRSLGVNFALLMGVLTLIATFGLGVGIAYIRKQPRPQLAGWHGWLALFLGGAALALPWVVVMRSYRGGL